MKTTTHQDKDLKKEFQIERLVLFSDAVFAIAITLLVIELKLPHLTPPYNDRDLLNALGDEVLAKFIGFIVSFVVIALYWLNHHLLFGLLHDYNRKVIWANLRFLFTIALMPFSSAFYSEYWNQGVVTPVAVYAINITLSGLAMRHLWVLITNPANHLCAGSQPPVLISYFKVRSMVAAAVFLFSWGVAYFSVAWAFVVPILIPVVMQLVKRYYRKKAPAVFHKGFEH